MSNSKNKELKKKKDNPSGNINDNNNIKVIKTDDSKNESKSKISDNKPTLKIKRK